jgi:chromosome segregation and condensation protein ScpB
MGEVSVTPETTARVIQDLTSMEVDPDKGERLYKAALVFSDKGVAYRMLAKSLPSGRIDLVHYGCDLDEQGNPTTKWRIRRILDQAPERFDKEIEAIKKSVQDDGEQVQGAWTHDLTAMKEVADQGASLAEWGKKIAAEVKKK